MNAATSQDYEIDLDDTELRPFGRLMLSKPDRLDANVKDISHNVSNLTNHVLKKLDTTGLIDVLKDTSNQSTSIMKEPTDTMKDFAKQDRTTAQAQIPSHALQEESTQILL